MNGAAAEPPRKINAPMRSSITTIGINHHFLLSISIFQIAMKGDWFTFEAPAFSNSEGLFGSVDIKYKW